MRTRILCLLAVGLPWVCFAGVDLRQEIGDKAFKASGLEKLTEAELATLNEAVAALLRSREGEVIAAQTEIITQKDQVIAEQQQRLEQQAGTPAEELPQGEDRFGLESIKQRVQESMQSEGTDTITSTLVGEFKGWSGNTRFELENGQVWKQTDRSSFVVRKMVNPVITIRRGMFSSYMLKVEGYNSHCKVERVR